MNKLKILIVEDNKINMKVISKYVEKFGHEIVQCWTAEESLEIIDDSFDIVLMDIAQNRNNLQSDLKEEIKRKRITTQLV